MKRPSDAVITEISYPSWIEKSGWLRKASQGSTEIKYEGKLGTQSKLNLDKQRYRRTYGSSVDETEAH
jgi:hypothetical protein